MLYPALPPAPPPVIITLTPQQIASTSPGRIALTQGVVSSRLTSKTTNAVSGVGKMETEDIPHSSEPGVSTTCDIHPSHSTKTNLVNHLLTKFLVNFEVEPEKKECSRSSQPERQLIASTNLEQSSLSGGDSQDKNIDNTVNNYQTNNSQIIQQEITSKTVAASASNPDGNPLGKILATVQELVAVSLYASLNPALNSNFEVATQPGDTASKHSENNSENNSDNQLENNSHLQNSHLIARLNSQNNQKSPNNQNSSLASNPNLDSSRLIAIVQGLINASISASINKNIAYQVTPTDKSHLVATTNNSNLSDNSSPNDAKVEIIKTEDNPQKVAAVGNSLTEKLKNAAANLNNSNPSASNTIQLARIPGEPFLVAVTINGREIGTIDIIQEGKLLLIPIEAFAEVTGFSAEKSGSIYTITTPLGEVKLDSQSLREINGVTYISNTELANTLRISLNLNTADLTLSADLPWRNTNQQGRKTELQPEFLAPKNGISSLRQELNITRVYGNTRLRSSTQLGGRIAGGSWRMRLNNNFVNQPDISEYFFYKRSGQFRYQLGRQQVGLHPLINSIDLTGLQLGFTNLPAESFRGSYGASELLPRRSRPMQTFTGEAPPASIAQLRVAGIAVAQQVVGFDGKYEFVDVNLPLGRNNEVEVAIFDRSNLNVPITVRSVRINASDLLLPAGGNVQLGGLGFSGNLVQSAFFDDLTADYSGKFVGFYQLRQGLSNNLTFEGSLQAAPDAFQSQAGLIWRLANPVVLSASVGTSDGKMGYAAELDVQLDQLEISANSQSLPEGFSRTRGQGEKFNHSLEVAYRPSNNLNIGFIARRFKDEITDSNYILPTFTIRPFSSLSLNGRPDIEGRYLLNAFYQPNWRTRLGFSSFGGVYNSNLTYRFARDYELSLGNEFGENIPGRYALTVGRNPSNFRSLSWSLGLALRDGEVAPLASAGMQVLPGLLARVEYQGIPSRSRGLFGGFGDDRFTLSLVSDLSFARGRVTPATYSGISKERGAIAGRLQLADSPNKIDLAGSRVRVINNRNRVVGNAVTDRSGNFFVGGLSEGIYTVELEPDELPVEVSTPKTSFVVEVANSGVTKLDFPLRVEFGLAGRITDVSGQPVGQIRVELVNASGVRVLSGVTDEHGLYRLDGVPVGKYILRIPPQENLDISDALPKRPVEISREFIYNQNLKLPVSAAVLKQKQAR